MKSREPSRVQSCSARFTRLVVRPALWSLCLLVLSCASADQLARKSQTELRAGHPQEAYKQAKKALRKDRSNAQARAALAAAGAVLARQRQDQVLAFASAGDTLAAGGSLLELEAFRHELADFGASPPPDTVFSQAELQIRTVGARIHYRRGRDALDAGQPKQAYDEFFAARSLVPGYRDVETRIRSSYEQALTRVAILPFENQTDVRGLSMEMSDKINTEVGSRLTPKEFRFTALLGRDEIYAQVPVTALTRLDREEALRIGRDVGADRVVTGRFYGLRTENNNGEYIITTYRRQPKKQSVAVLGEAPKPGFEYVEDKLHIARHERRVWVTYDFSVLDTKDGKPLLTRTETVPAEAVVLWTDYEPVGDCDSYSLFTPELQKSQPDAIKTINGDWQKCAGSWKLSAFLEHARSDRKHASYRPEYRQSFYRFSSDYPVFLGEPPPEGDLAYVALDPMWESVLAALRELDKR